MLVLPGARRVVIDAGLARVPRFDPGSGMTRLDCMVGSSALMRQALTQASHHCAHRSVGGRVLAEQPLMQNVLADLALESEARGRYRAALVEYLSSRLSELDEDSQRRLKPTR